MKTLHLEWIGALAALGLAGCAPGAELSPGPVANEVPVLEEAAITSVAGVSIIAQADAWEGDPEVITEVTPMRVIIDNNSGSPIRLQYSEFALVGPAGERYAAIPPFMVEGTIEEPVIVDVNPVTSPLFTVNDFLVAPYYASIYPTLSPFANPFYFDPLYYENYATVWADMALPTEQMLEVALPEGVIMPGGSVSGFLYFEKVDDDLPYVTFTADVVGALDSDIFGRVSIPFVEED